MTADPAEYVSSRTPDPKSQEPDDSRFKGMAGQSALYFALALQAICAVLYTGERWTDILVLQNFEIPWLVQELVEILATVGLLLGVVVSTVFVFRNRDRMKIMHRQIDAASGNFASHVESLFAEWALSPSERAVAVYAMKGFSNAEIANLRGTTAATVKSQMNAIYRKSGLANRQQLIAFLVEELLSGVSVVAPRTA